MAIVVLSIKALIVKDNTFLIIKDLNDNKWELPGGRVNYGEDPNNTLIREIKEELNVKIKVGKFVGMCYLIKNKNRETVMNVFSAIPNSYNFDLTKNPAKESLGEAKFVSKKEFLSKKYQVYHKSLKTLIKKTDFKNMIVKFK